MPPRQWRAPCAARCNAPNAPVVGFLRRLVDGAAITWVRYMRVDAGCVGWLGLVRLGWTLDQPTNHSPPKAHMFHIFPNKTPPLAPVFPTPGVVSSRPASALGETLVERLNGAGMKLFVEEPLAEQEETRCGWSGVLSFNPSMISMYICV